MRNHVLVRVGAAMAGLLCTIAAACAQGGGGKRGDGAAMNPNALTAAEQNEGWRLLFDGESTRGWRNYRQQGMSAGWQVVEGALTRVAQAGDIITTDQFGDFELALEWMVAPGGNSGIFYRVSEDEEYPWQTGPEMQVLDNERHADGKSPLTSAGSLFALYPVPPGAARPAGQWNAVRVVVRGAHVEHWLNGTKVVDAELGSADWNARLAASKFAPLERYGRNPRGHIGLQDHGDRVSFRGIKIRALP
ncbi:MAG TPA: DUF1080 domain-containing protein [Gemmatimonadaceae bacterium]|nr:DUF1080 domain-containing protein [Gemmatimonadaceae bacterium]